MEDVARIVLALESPDVVEEVMHFLDRTGRARVIGTAIDQRQLVEAVRQLDPDVVVAGPALLPPSRSLNRSALLALDTSQSVGTLRRAIRSGAIGFYLWPAEREELAHAATRVRPSRDHGHVERASVLAVFGARGGVGTTFVATHLAAAFARSGKRCVLVDMDAVFADVSSALGVPADESVRTIAELAVLQDEVVPDHVTEVVWHHPAGFDALLAPGEGVQRLGGEDYRRAIAAARPMCDVVLLHVPRGLDEVARAGLEVADRVLLVLGLDVLSFRDAKRVIEVAGLSGRCAFVVNRVARSEIAPSDVERAFGQPPLAVIASDRAVPRAQDHGRLIPSRGRAGRAFEELARRTIEPTP